MNIFKIHPRNLFRFNNKKPVSKKNSRSALRLLDLHKHPLVIPVTAGMAIFFISCATLVVLSGETIGANDTKVVSLYIDGHTRVVPTRAHSVGDVINKANIELRDGDLVEPSLDSQIVTQDFNINVYRAKPVTVVDDKGEKVTTKVVESTPSDMAKRAGVTVYPEDNVTIAAPADALRDGVIGAKVVIERATPAMINLYGTPVAARSHATTVGELLTEKGIKALEGDTVQPSPNTPLSDNAQIFIIRFGKQVVSTEEEIPAPIEKVSDANTPLGKTTVKEPGSPGKKVVTYEIELQNNKEVSRRSIQEVIAVQPVKRVVAEGTKVVISNPSANVEIGRRLAASRGWTGAEFNCLYMLWQKESKWNHLAGNRSSGAYGIPQALPGTKMATSGADWQTNPETQITWGLGYITRSYGTPCKAWQKSQSVGWY